MSSTGPGLPEQVRLRLGPPVAGANFAGTLVVFLFLVLGLPNPPAVQHQTRLLALNAAVFALVVAIGFPLAWRWSRGTFRARVGWLYEQRGPDGRELELTLRFPLSQQAIAASLWLFAAVLFGTLNAFFSVELAVNIAITIVLGGMVTCALGYLLTERLMRPITARALAVAVPARPQLPGVRVRALLAWTLGSGVVLVGLLLIGFGALHEPRFTRERLAILILTLAATGLLVGSALILGLARSLADPIESLRHAMAGVERGDLEQRVTVDDGSDVGLLQAGFNRMLEGLRERERLRDLFGRQVGEDVVRHALEHGVALGGESREAAVLFVDLQGSTTLAEKRDPAEVVALLNDFFAIVVEVVAAHEGWVNKFEGDAALCVFGAPLPDADAAAHALAAARALRERLEREGGELRAGIGVSAGRVVAGNIGAARRFEYTVIGDPVNEAARLTEMAKRRPERLLASGAAVSSAGAEEARHWLTGEQVTLRGRSRPTEVALPEGS